MKIAAPILVVLGVLFAGCGGGSGSCFSSGGSPEECKPDWSEEECQNWDSTGVNGAHWSFSTSSCDDLGFVVECADGTHLQAGHTCL